MKLTVQTTAGLKLPTGAAEKIFWDDELKGLGIRLREGGSRTWIYQFKVGAKQRRMTLGPVTRESFSTIRDKNRAVIKLGIRDQVDQLKSKVRLGEDPAATKANARIAASETFGATLQRFLAYQRGRLRPRTYPDLERHLLKHSRMLHGLQLTQISRRDIATVIGAVRGDTTSNRVRTSLSSFFSWAMGEGLLDQNPVVGTNKREEKKRTRTLSPQELRLIWTHAGDDHYGVILRLLALTGARADEIAGLRWSEVGQDLITLPPARVKNGREHEIPLSSTARKIIEAQPRRTNPDGTPRDLIFGNAQGPFSGWSNSKNALVERMMRTAGKPLPHWTPHDLRRSFSTHANELGFAQPHVIEAALGHVSGFRAGVAGVYNLARYRSEKCALLDRWGEQLMAWVEGRETNVITLSRSA
jgi:integrase